MSTPQRQQPLGVIDRLLEDPYRFGFFQAVRLFEHWFLQRGTETAAEVRSRRLRFRNSLSLAFPASEIAGLRVIDDGPDGIEGIELTPAFIGLLGASGTLPNFYTEMLAQRELYQRDEAGRAFMDMFLHRAVVLFYQAWRKHRLPVQFEADRRNHFMPMVLALAGIGMPSLRERLRAREGGVSDDALAYFSGTLQRRPVSAEALQRTLSAYFRVPVRVDSFVGRWFGLPRDNQSELGRHNIGLGLSAVVGERVWQRDLRLRLVVGPLSQAMFRRFLPGGTAALALRELLTLMTGVTLEYEIRLALRAAEVRGICLGGRPDNPGGAMLGWNGFLATRSANADRLDAGYDLHALA